MSRKDTVYPSLTLRRQETPETHVLRQQEVEGVRATHGELSPNVQPHRDIAVDQTHNFHKGHEEGAKLGAGAIPAPIRLSCRVAPLSLAHIDVSTVDSADPEYPVRPMVTQWCLEQDNTITIRDAQCGTILQSIKDLKKGCTPTALMHAPYLGPLTIPDGSTDTKKLNKPESIPQHEHDFVWVGFNDGSIRVVHAVGRPVFGACKYDQSQEFIVYELSKHHAGAITCFAVAPDHTTMKDVSKYDDFLTTNFKENHSSHSEKDIFVKMAEARKKLAVNDDDNLNHFICAGSTDSLISVWNLRDVYSRIAAVRMSLGGNSEKAKRAGQTLKRAPMTARKTPNTFGVDGQKRTDHPTFFESELFTWYENDQPMTTRPASERCSAHCASISCRPAAKLKGAVSGIRSLMWQSTNVIPCPESQYPRPQIVVPKGDDDHTSDSTSSGKKSADDAKPHLESRHLKVQDEVREDRYDREREEMKLTKKEYESAKKEAMRQGTIVEAYNFPFIPWEKLKSRAKRVDILLSGDDEGHLTFWDLNEEVFQYNKHTATAGGRSYSSATNGDLTERSTSIRPFIPSGPSDCRSFSPSSMTTHNIPVRQTDKRIHFIGGVAVTASVGLLPENIYHSVPNLVPEPKPDDPDPFGDDTSSEDSDNIEVPDNLFVTHKQAQFDMFCHLRIFAALSDGSFFQIDCQPTQPHEETDAQVIAGFTSPKFRPDFYKPPLRPFDESLGDEVQNITKISGAVDYAAFTVAFNMEQVDSRGGLLNNVIYNRHNNTVWASGSDGEVVVYNAQNARILARIVARNNDIVNPPTWDELQQRLYEYGAPKPRDRSLGTGSQVHFSNLSGTELDHFQRFLIFVAEDETKTIEAPEDGDEEKKDAEEGALVETAGGDDNKAEEGTVAVVNENGEEEEEEEGYHKNGQLKFFSDVPNSLVAIFELEELLSERIEVTQKQREKRYSEKRHAQRVARYWELKKMNREECMSKFQLEFNYKAREVGRRIFFQWHGLAAMHKRAKRKIEDQQIFIKRAHEDVKQAQEVHEGVEEASAIWERAKQDTADHMEVFIAEPKHQNQRWETLQKFATKSIMRKFLTKSSPALGYRNSVEVMIAFWWKWAKEKSYARRRQNRLDAVTRGVISGLNQAERLRCYHGWIHVIRWNQKKRRQAQQAEKFLYVLQLSMKAEWFHGWAVLARQKKETRHTTHAAGHMATLESEERQIKDRAMAIEPHIYDYAAEKTRFIDLQAETNELQDELQKLVVLKESIAAVFEGDLTELESSVDADPEALDAMIAKLQEGNSKTSAKLADTKEQNGFAQRQIDFLEREKYEAGLTNPLLELVGRLGNLKSITPLSDVEYKESSNTALTADLTDAIDGLKSEFGVQTFEDVEEMARGKLDSAVDEFFTVCEKAIAEDQARVKRLEDDRAAKQRWADELERVRLEEERRAREKQERAEERVRRADAKRSRATDRANQDRKNIAEWRAEEIPMGWDLQQEEKTEVSELRTSLEKEMSAIKVKATETAMADKLQADQQEATTKREQEDIDVKAAHETSVSEITTKITDQAKTKDELTAKLVELGTQQQALGEKETTLNQDKEAETKKVSDADAENQEKEAAVTTAEEEAKTAHDEVIAKLTAEQATLIEEKTALETERADRETSGKAEREAKVANLNAELTKTEESAKDANDAAETYGTLEQSAEKKDKAAADATEAEKTSKAASVKLMESRNAADAQAKETAAADSKVQEAQTKVDALQADAGEAPPVAPAETGTQEEVDAAKAELDDLRSKLEVAEADTKKEELEAADAKVKTAEEDKAKADQELAEAEQNQKGNATEDDEEKKDDPEVTRCGEAVETANKCLEDAQADQATKSEAFVQAEANVATLKEQEESKVTAVKDAEAKLAATEAYNAASKAHDPESAQEELDARKAELEEAKKELEAAQAKEAEFKATIAQQEADVTSAMNAQAEVKKVKEAANKAHAEATLAHEMAGVEQTKVDILKKQLTAAEDSSALETELAERQKKVDEKDAEVTANAASIEEKTKAHSEKTEALQKERDELAAAKTQEEERRTGVAKTLDDRQADLSQEQEQNAKEIKETESAVVEAQAALKNLEEEKQRADEKFEADQTECAAQRKQEDEATQKSHDDNLAESLATEEKRLADVLARVDADLKDGTEEATNAKKEEVDAFAAKKEPALEEKEVDTLVSPHNAEQDDVETDTEADPKADESLVPPPYETEEIASLPEDPANLPASHKDRVLLTTPLASAGPYSRWGHKAFDFTAVDFIDASDEDAHNKRLGLVQKARLAADGITSRRYDVAAYRQDQDAAYAKLVENAAAEEKPAPEEKVAEEKPEEAAPESTEAETKPEEAAPDAESKPAEEDGDAKPSEEPVTQEAKPSEEPVTQAEEEPKKEEEAAATTEATEVEQEGRFEEIPCQPEYRQTEEMIEMFTAPVFNEFSDNLANVCCIVAIGDGKITEDDVEQAPAASTEEEAEATPAVEEEKPEENQNEAVEENKEDQVEVAAEEENQDEAVEENKEDDAPATETTEEETKPDEEEQEESEKPQGSEEANTEKPQGSEEANTEDATKEAESAPTQEQEAIQEESAEQKPEATETEETPAEHADEGADE